MVLPIFKDVFLAIDKERNVRLKNIAEIAQGIKDGDILNDIGLIMLREEVLNLGRIEEVYSEVMKVDKIVEKVLPESEKTRKVSPVIEA